jgi:hypothetical protein
MRRIAIAVVAVATVAVWTLTAAPAQARLPRLPRLLAAVHARNDFRVRPFLVVYTGDGSGLLGGRYRHPRRHFPRNFGRLHWRHWGHHVARTHGTVWLDDCRPSCAAGHFHGHRAGIRAHRVRHHHFTRLRIVYRYHGHRVVDRRKLGRHGHTYSWDVGRVTVR